MLIVNKADVANLEGVVSEDQPLVGSITGETDVDECFNCHADHFDATLARDTRKAGDQLRQANITVGGSDGPNRFTPKQLIKNSQGTSII